MESRWRKTTATTKQLNLKVTQTSVWKQLNDEVILSLFSILLDPPTIVSHNHHRDGDDGEKEKGTTRVEIYYKLGSYNTTTTRVD
jgi:hypothetical protein